MMPSVRDKVCMASNACESVTMWYSARPVSLSQACSGPTPG